MSFTDEQQAAFQRDGYIIVSGLFELEQISAALEEVEMRTYGKRFNEYLADLEQGIVSKADNYALGSVNEINRTRFPVGNRVLDGLLENERYLDCFAACLGTQEMTYLNAHLFVRAGANDTRHAPEPWQGYHLDDNSCSFLPPHPDVERRAYVNSWIALHDIEEDGAPLHVIPGSHRQIADALPRLVKSGDGIRGGFRDIREITEIGKPVPVIAKAGDVLLYSSYLLHAAVGFTNKKKQRALWAVGLGRAENDAWNKLGNIYQGVDLPYAIQFWTETTPRVRSLFGWPRPGDSYYTPETLGLLESWFPGIDLQPYI